MSKRINRLQLMLNDDELEALDEWRFRMRMPSRAAAIRQLLRFGLELDVDPKVVKDEAMARSSAEIGVLDSPLEIKPLPKR